MTYKTHLNKAKESFAQKDFLKMADVSRTQIMNLIELAIELKKLQKEGLPHPILAGKSLAMIFEKSSTRTRVSFETGMYQLGGQAQFLSSADIQLGNGETVSDTAQVLSRFVDGIMIRTFGHEIVEELAESAQIPIINGLTDDSHPCQVLADLMTIYEKKGSFDHLKLAYIGDGNNMTQSLVMACAIMGIDCHIAVPEGAGIKAEVLKEAQNRAEKTGAEIKEINNPREAVRDADVVYTDVWASMGWEGDKEERLIQFKDYQVNEALTAHAKEDHLFMHCLPAIRGEEVSAEVIDGRNSIVFDQAENRLHAQKAVLAVLMS